MNHNRPNTYQLYAALIIVLVVSQSSYTQAQTCGFGCFGLGGFYGGYNVQSYDPKGLNGFIRAYNLQHSSSLKSDLKEFGKYASGFRLGANVFRTRSSLLFFSIKGFYQFLREEHEAVENLNPLPVTTLYTLNLNYYGVGMDFGFVLSRRFDLKLVDAEVTFNSALFKTRSSTAESSPIETSFKNQKTYMGYTVGSGLIFHIIADYLSLEATAGYSKIAVEKLQIESNQKLQGSFDSIESFVSNGGFSATMQLNVGIPLY